MSPALTAAFRIADLKIIWQGGAVTDLAMPMNKVGSRLTKGTSEEVIDLVRRLAERYDDTTIAAVLGKQHRRTATGLPWTRARVTSLRFQYRIAICPPEPRNVTPAGHDVLVVPIGKAEKILHVSRHTLYRWLREGFITGEQLTPGAPWHIRIDQALRNKIRPEVPDGWLPLAAAAATLGIAARPCCTRSSAANCKPSTSTKDAAKDCVSRSNLTSLDYSTHPDNRKVQC